MPTMPRTTPEPARRSPLAILDIVAGIALTVLGAFIGLIMLAVVNQLGGLTAECEGVVVDGTRCSPDYLAAMGILGNAIIVFAWFLGLGLLILRVIRRRIVFWVPIVAVVVMIGGFYLVAALLNAGYLPSSST